MSDSGNTAFGAGALPVAQSSTGFQPSDDAADAALAADGRAPRRTPSRDVPREPLATVVSRSCELEDLEGSVHDAAGLATGFGDVTSAGEMVGADCEVAEAGHDAGS